MRGRKGGEGLTAEKIATKNDRRILKMPDQTPCGIELPQVFFDGPVDMAHIRNFATRAETLGYDSLWLQERIIGDFVMLEPVTLLSYVAAITTKLKLGTSVMLLPLRNPIQL